MTSPLTERCMSVTSSGRSSTSTTMRWHSGLFLVIALAIACRTIVLPALGGETIRPRWPLPIGATRSMIRVVRMLGLGLQAQPVLRVQRGQLGEVGAALRACSGSTPLTVSRRTSALNFSRRSPSRGWRTAPVIDVALAQAVACGPGRARRRRRWGRAGSRWSGRTRSCRGCRGCRRPGSGRRPR